MIIEQTIDKLYRMKLFGMAESVKDRLSRSDHQDLAVSDLLGLIVDDECMYRDNKRMTSRLAGAKFKDKSATMESIEYKGERGVTKSQLLEFAKLSWVKKHQNLAITGLTGVGKSWIAQALGNEACREGMRVLFLRQPLLVHTVLHAKAAGSFQNLLKKFLKVDLLIIDDLGVTLMTEEIRRDFLEVLEDRHGRGSTIITSQLPIKEWHDYFGGGRIGDALCDRFVRSAHRLELTGRTRRITVEEQKDLVDCQDLS
jgi:DNA replication protein DnaC